MDFPVDILGSTSQEDLQRSAELYMSNLLYSNPNHPQQFILPNSNQIPLSVSTAGFVPLYGADLTQKVLALFSPEDQCTAVALYLVDRWWAVEDILKTSDSSREGLLEVSTLGERIVLYVLNRIVYRAKEMEENEVPFLCHTENDFAKVLWKDGEAIGFYSVKPEGSLCDTFLTQRYLLPVMDSLFVRRAHRGNGYGLCILEDFVDCFKEEALGLKYPLTPAMYRVCAQYLTTYPADKELLWEVQSVGGPFQRSSIANKLKTKTFTAGDSSSSLIRESMETEVVTMQKTIQGTVTSMEISEEVVIINKNIKEAEGMRRGELSRKRIREETTEVPEEHLPEKINRVGEAEPEVEASAAKLVAHEPVVEREEERGPNVEMMAIEEEEQFTKAEPLQNVGPMEVKVTANEESEEREERRASQDFREGMTLPENDVHKEGIEMDNGVQDNIHTVPERVPEEVSKDSADQEVSPEAECPPVEAAVPLEDAHSPEMANAPTQITAEQGEINQEEPSIDREQLDVQTISSLSRDDVREWTVEQMEHDKEKQSEEEKEDQSPKTERGTLKKRGTRVQKTALRKSKRISKQHQKEDEERDKVVEGLEEKKEDVVQSEEGGEATEKHQSPGVEGRVLRTKTPARKETLHVSKLLREPQLKGEEDRGKNIENKEDGKEKDSGATTEDDQSPVTGSRVLRRRTKTPVRKTTARRSKRLSKQHHKEESEKDKNIGDQEDEMDEETGETTEKDQSPITDGRTLRRRTKTPVKKSASRSTQLRNQQYKDKKEKGENLEDQEAEEDEMEKYCAGETAEKDQSPVTGSRVLRRRTKPPSRETTARRSKRLSEQQMPGEEDGMKEKVGETTEKGQSPFLKSIVLRSKIITPVKQTSARRSKRFNKQNRKEDETEKKSIEDPEENDKVEKDGFDHERMEEEEEKTVDPPAEERSLRNKTVTVRVKKSCLRRSRRLSKQHLKEDENVQVDSDEEEGRDHKQQEESVEIEEEGTQTDENKEIEGEERAKERNEEAAEISGEENEVVEKSVIADEENMENENEKQAEKKENVEEENIHELGKIVVEENKIKDDKLASEETEDNKEKECQESTEVEISVEERIEVESEKAVEDIEGRKVEEETVEDKVVEEKMEDEGAKIVNKESVENMEDGIQGSTEKENAVGSEKIAYVGEKVVEEVTVEDEDERVAEEETVGYGDEEFLKLGGAEEKVLGEEKSAVEDKNLDNKEDEETEEAANKKQPTVGVREIGEKEEIGEEAKDGRTRAKKHSPDRGVPQTRPAIPVKKTTACESKLLSKKQLEEEEADEQTESTGDEEKGREEKGGKRRGVDQSSGVEIRVLRTRIKTPAENTAVHTSKRLSRQKIMHEEGNEEKVVGQEDEDEEMDVEEGETMEKDPSPDHRVLQTRLEPVKKATARRSKRLSKQQQKEDEMEMELTEELEQETDDTTDEQREEIVEIAEEGMNVHENKGFEVTKTVEEWKEEAEGNSGEQNDIEGESVGVEDKINDQGENVLEEENVDDKDDEEEMTETLGDNLSEGESPLVEARILRRKTILVSITPEGKCKQPSKNTNEQESAVDKEMEKVEENIAEQIVVEEEKDMAGKEKVVEDEGNIMAEDEKVKDKEDEETEETTKNDQSTLVESRVLITRVKTPIKKAAVHGAKLLSKKQPEEEKDEQAEITGDEEKGREEKGGKRRGVDQSSVVETRVLRTRVKTPAKNTPVRASKRLSRHKIMHEEGNEEKVVAQEDWDEEMDEEEGETMKKDPSPDHRVLQTQPKTPVKTATARRSKRLSKQQQKEDEMEMELIEELEQEKDDTTDEQREEIVEIAEEGINVHENEGIEVTKTVEKWREEPERNSGEQNDVEGESVGVEDKINVQGENVLEEENVNDEEKTETLGDNLEEGESPLVEARILRRKTILVSITPEGKCKQPSKNTNEQESAVDKEMEKVEENMVEQIVMGEQKDMLGKEKVVEDEGNTMAEDEKVEDKEDEETEEMTKNDQSTLVESRVLITRVKTPIKKAAKLLTKKQQEEEKDEQAETTEDKEKGGKRREEDDSSVVETRVLRTRVKTPAKKTAVRASKHLSRQKIMDEEGNEEKVVGQKDGDEEMDKDEGETMEKGHSPDHRVLQTQPETPVQKATTRRSKRLSKQQQKEDEMEMELTEELEQKEMDTTDEQREEIVTMAEEGMRMHENEEIGVTKTVEDWKLQAEVSTGDQNEAAGESVGVEDEIYDQGKNVEEGNVDDNDDDEEMTETLGDNLEEGESPLVEARILRRKTILVSITPEGKCKQPAKKNTNEQESAVDEEMEKVEENIVEQIVVEEEKDEEMDEEGGDATEDHAPGHRVLRTRPETSVNKATARRSKRQQKEHEMVMELQEELEQDEEVKTDEQQEEIVEVTVEGINVQENEEIGGAKLDEEREEEAEGNTGEQNEAGGEGVGVEENIYDQGENVLEEKNEVDKEDDEEEMAETLGDNLEEDDESPVVEARILRRKTKIVTATPKRKHKQCSQKNKNKQDAAGEEEMEKVEQNVVEPMVEEEENAMEGPQNVEDEGNNMIGGENLKEDEEGVEEESSERVENEVEKREVEETKIMVEDEEQGVVDEKEIEEDTEPILSEVGEKGEEHIRELLERSSVEPDMHLSLDDENMEEGYTECQGEELMDKEMDSIVRKEGGGEGIPEEEIETSAEKQIDIGEKEAGRERDEKEGENKSNATPCKEQESAEKSTVAVDESLAVKIRVLRGKTKIVMETPKRTSRRLSKRLSKEKTSSSSVVESEEEKEVEKAGETEENTTVDGNGDKDVASPEGEEGRRLLKGVNDGEKTDEMVLDGIKDSSGEEEPQPVKVRVLRGRTKIITGTPECKNIFKKTQQNKDQGSTHETLRYAEKEAQNDAGGHLGDEEQNVVQEVIEQGEETTKVGEEELVMEGEKDTSEMEEVEAAENAEQGGEVIELKAKVETEASENGQEMEKVIEHKGTVESEEAAASEIGEQMEEGIDLKATAETEQVLEDKHIEEDKAGDLCAEAENLEPGEKMEDLGESQKNVHEIKEVGEEEQDEDSIMEKEAAIEMASSEVEENTALLLLPSSDEADESTAFEKRAKKRKANTSTTMQRCTSKQLSKQQTAEASKGEETDESDEEGKGAGCDEEVVSERRVRRRGPQRKRKMIDLTPQRRSKRHRRR